MRSNFKTIVKNNKAAIITSIITSLFTIIFLVLLMIAGIILIIKFGLLDKTIADFLIKNNKTIVTNMPNKTIKINTITEESRVINVVEKANPAVISIVITKDVPIIEQYYQDINPFGNNNPLNDFFNNGFSFRIPQQRQKGTEKREVGGGSGFFMSSDGFIITNKHVVDDDTAEYTVFTNDGKKYNAKILAKDSMLDVAILKVEGKNFSYLSFSNSDLLKPGQTVIAIGNALAEFRNSVSRGIISGLSRSIIAGDFFGKSEQLENVIQTDAAINLGNSGGPLLDLNGSVIGMNVAVQQGAENIGFALPSNTIKNIADSVKKYGEIIKPYLGIRYIQITKNLKEKNNLTVDYGILVLRGNTQDELAIIPGSPADKAGIVENDIILEIDNVKLEQGKSFASIIRQKQIDQIIKLKIFHKGSEKIIEVKLEKTPKNLL
ncbi:MAG: trypsin-like peptidase domain-containing protein [Patescibacteria group bacterium]